MVIVHCMLVFFGLYMYYIYHGKYLSEIDGCSSGKYISTFCCPPLIYTTCYTCIGESHNVSSPSSSFRFSDELKIAEKRLKDLQQRNIDDYVGKLKENKDDDNAIKVLKDVFVDLRILNEKDGYKRLETRTHHNLIQLEKDVEKCRPVTLAELFQPEREGGSPPRRILIIGKAGIGT